MLGVPPVRRYGYVKVATRATGMTAPKHLQISRYSVVLAMMKSEESMASNNSLKRDR